MLFEVESTSMYPTPRLAPVVKITYTAVPVGGKYWGFSFINPKTGETVTIKITAKATPINQGDVKDSSSGLTLANYRLHVLETVKNIDVLNSYYTIELISDVLTLTAKEASSKLIPTGMAFTSGAGFSILYSPDFHQPTERDGYELQASIYVEDTFMSGNFNFVDHYKVPLDSNAKGIVSVGEMVNEGIEKTWTSFPLPDRTKAYYFPNITRRYYVKFVERWKGNEEGNTKNSKIRYVQWGGHSTDNANLVDPMAAIDVNHKFLSTFSSGKIVHETQDDWLTFLNTGFEKTITVEVIVQNNDGSIGGTLIYEDIILPWQCITVQTGYKFLGILGMSNASGVKYWTIKVSDGAAVDYCEPFRYYLNPICLLHTVLTFNNYGVPETFYTNGEWVESFNTSKNVAQRSQQFNQSNWRPHLFVFGKKNTQSIKSATQALENEVAKRMENVLNSTISYIWEEVKFVPVIIEANSTEISQLGEFTKRVELNILKANISTETSFIPDAPKLYPEYDGQSIYVFKIETNNISLVTFGNLNIKKDDVALTAKTWDAPNKKYAAITAVSGKYRVECVVVDIDGRSFTLVHHFTHSENRFSYETNKNGSGVITVLRTGAAASDMNVDSDDGFPQLNVLLSTSTSVPSTWSFNGTKRVTYLKSNFNDFTGLEVSNMRFRKAEYYKFVNLDKLKFTNCELGTTVYLNNLPTLKNIEIATDTTVNHIDIGYMPNLVLLKLTALALTTAAIEEIIERTWQMRQFRIAAPPTIQFISNLPTISAKTTAIVNGTGDYVGQGLAADLGYTITFTP